MDVYTCRLPQGPLDAVVEIPGSKSLTNRALIVAALADGVSLLRGALLAEDTRLMVAALRRLGIAITVDEQARVAEVTGCRGLLPETGAELFCGNSGTTLRFCMALCASGQGEFTLDGVERMRSRPVRGLAEALQSLGCGIEYLDREGYPPVRLHARGLRGGQVSLQTPDSSQMVSGLLMAGPCAGHDLFVEVSDAPSVPYVRMTVDLMQQFGVAVLADELRSAGAGSVSLRLVLAAPQRYRAVSLAIEPDASNAMYFLAAPALAGGRVTVEGLGTESIQGDKRFVDVLEQMGCIVHRKPARLAVEGPADGRLRAVDVDLNDMPDMVPTLAVLAVFAEGVTRVRNVANLRIKETDRLAALARELSKLGAAVAEEKDGLTVTPPVQPVPAEIDTYKDHRMAMSFALAGLRVPDLIIRDPRCCEKTFPEFFDKWEPLLGK